MMNISSYDDMLPLTMIVIGALVVDHSLQHIDDDND